MRLWTIQTEGAFRDFEAHHVLRGSKTFVEEYERSPYSWMVGRMSERVGPPPVPDAMPVWAWYQWEGKRKKPDLRSSGHLPRGESGVRIAFDTDSAHVVLSDFDLWHYVLNHCYLPTSERDDVLFEEELKRRGISLLERPMPDAECQERVEKSWNRIFDLEWVEQYVTASTDGKSIQACVWEVHMEQVVEVTRFRSR